MAFDTVPHQRLLYKLQSLWYGIQGRTHQWISQFIQNRSQKWFLTALALPQSQYPGTVLGPLLFLLYVNGLPDCINNSTITPFADDCIVYRHISNSDEQDINSIAEWASSWQMKFNVTKCCCVHFSSSQTGYFSNIYMLYNTLLPCSNHFKYLGITLQSDLKWDQHNY